MYKRQVMYRTPRYTEINVIDNYAPTAKADVTIVDAVSYTHLDVHKRQVLHPVQIHSACRTVRISFVILL